MKLRNTLTRLACTAMIFFATFASAETVLVVYGNRSSCSYCRKLDTLLKADEFTAWATAADVKVIDADKTAEPDNYADYKATVGYKGGDWPQVFVMEDTGRKLGSFVARGYTVAKLIDKIKTLCPACSDTATPPVVTPPVCSDVSNKFKCPKCSKILEVK